MISYKHGGFTQLSSWTPRAIKQIYFLHKALPNGSKFYYLFFMSRYTRYL